MFPEALYKALDLAKDALVEAQHSRVNARLRDAARVNNHIQRLLNSIDRLKLDLNHLDDADYNRAMAENFSDDSKKDWPENYGDDDC